jgi:hypothetical protein
MATKADVQRAAETAHERAIDAAHQRLMDLESHYWRIDDECGRSAVVAAMDAIVDIEWESE